MRDQTSRSGPTEPSVAVTAITSPGVDPRSAATTSSNSPEANVLVVGPIATLTGHRVNLPSFTRQVYGKPTLPPEEM